MKIDLEAFLILYFTRKDIGILIAIIVVSNNIVLSEIIHDS